MTERKQIVFVIGPSGCGKSTLAAELAEALGGVFLEGDDFHPPENRARMQRGIALDDAARLPWLDELGRSAQRSIAPWTVVACSALKRRYRQTLQEHCPAARFLFLDIAKDEVADRLANRQNHFMPASLLDSQFADLERPTATEANVITLRAGAAPADMLSAALSALQG